MLHKAHTYNIIYIYTHVLILIQAIIQDYIIALDKVKFKFLHLNVIDFFIYLLITFLLHCKCVDMLSYIHIYNNVNIFIMAIFLVFYK